MQKPDKYKCHQRKQAEAAPMGMMLILQVLTIGQTDEDVMSALDVT
jgi:hypothetical protein